MYNESEIFEENKNELIDFYKSKGISIPHNNPMWCFITTQTGMSYGIPANWGDLPAVFVCKSILVDGFIKEEFRYCYCPKINKGAKIIIENEYFKVIEEY